MGLVAHNSAPSSDEQAVLAPTKPYREFLFRARFSIQSLGLVSTVLVSMLNISIMIAEFICPYIWTPSLRGLPSDLVKGCEHIRHSRSRGGHAAGSALYHAGEKV